jgi:hypothetical protein
MQVLHKSMLVVQDPFVVADLIGPKNRELDKSTLAFDIVYDLYQEAFVEAPGDEKWKTKRKIWATAFLKDRLINMT